MYTRCKEVIYTAEPQGEKFPMILKCFSPAKPFPHTLHLIQSSRSLCSVCSWYCCHFTCEKVKAPGGVRRPCQKREGGGEAQNVDVEARFPGGRPPSAELPLPRPEWEEVWTQDGSPPPPPPCHVPLVPVRWARGHHKAGG